MYYDMSQSPILRGRPIPAGASAPLLWTLSGIVLAACSVNGGVGGGGDGVDRSSTPSTQAGKLPIPVPPKPVLPSVTVTLASSPQSEGKTPVALIPTFDTGSIVDELHITRDELNAASRKPPASGTLKAMANGEEIEGTWKIAARSDNFPGDTTPIASQNPIKTLNWQITPDITGSTEKPPIEQSVTYEFTPTDTDTYSSSTITFNLRVLGDAPVRNITLAEMTTDATPEASGSLAAIAPGGSFSATAGRYGTFTITATGDDAGKWTYDIDPLLLPQDVAVTVTETITVTFTAPADSGTKTTTYELVFTIARPGGGEAGSSPNVALAAVDFGDAGTDDLPPLDTPTPDSGMI